MICVRYRYRKLQFQHNILPTELLDERREGLTDQLLNQRCDP